MKLTSDSLAPQLAQRLLPAYLVSGDEPLLAGEAADAIRARARAAGFTEREVHFIERAGDWEDVRGSAANLSLFGARRVLEIRLTSGKPGVAGNAALVSLLEARDPDTLFLMLAPRLDRDAQSADWVRAVEAHGAWVQVWPVDSTRLLGWLKARARSLGLEASEEALELLAARTEGNLLAAHQELAQLALLNAGLADERRGGAGERGRQCALRCVPARGGGARRGDDARAAHARRVARGGHGGDARAVGAHQGAARRLDGAGG